MLCAITYGASAQTTARVSGSVFWYASDSPNHIPVNNTPGIYVKLCTNPDGTGTCGQAEVNSGAGWSMYLPINRTYYVFSWNDALYWGSRNSITDFNFNYQPTRFTSINLVNAPLEGVQVRSYPRPLPPQAIYPANGATGIPTSFTLKWTSGKDSKRQYQAVYDVYAYGDGAAESKILSNVACNPDASGYCQYAISGQKSSTRFNWRVVAKLNPGVATPGNPYYEQTSPTFNFTTLTDPAAKYNFGTANLNHYLSAASCGGGSVNAMPGSASTCESFQIIDLNGGDINHGDSVRIRIGGYYLSATNGGGSTLMANVTSPGSWETFTIRKTSGSGRILDGHRVAFQAANGMYVYSDNGGGGAVWVSGTAIGGWEPFIFIPRP
jgi:hypothetical protein